MMIFTPASPAWSTSGPKTSSARRRLSATGSGRVATDERADGRALEPGGGVDAGVEVPVVRRPLVRVGVKVVVVVADRGDLQPVAGEELERLLGLGVAEPVDVEVGRRERAVAESRPGRDLEGLELLGLGPCADVGEAALGHAGREESELHDALSFNSSWTAMSSHRWAAAERSTAAVI